MSDLNFIDTDSGRIYDEIVVELENGVAEPLYPGDERRIFAEAQVPLFVALLSKVNDAARQKMLRYARGDVLDALGERGGVIRQEPIPAKTTLRFSLSAAVSRNIIIPQGTRATSDNTRYFATDVTVVLAAGTTSVEVGATSTGGGTEYNDIQIGAISVIVDLLPYIDGVTNITATDGGADKEDDDLYRERIRTAPAKLSVAGPEQAYRYWAMSADSSISDASVSSVVETITRTLPVYDGHAFKGGSKLLPDTLIVYLPDGETPADPNADYAATYDDELLTIELSGALSAAQEVKIDIDREMDGRVKIVPICAGGEIPDQTLLNKVLAACSADDVRPLTDSVEVEAPAVIYFDIELRYYTTAANEAQVVQNVEGADGAIARYVYWQGSSLNRDLNPDYLRRLILSPDWEEDLVGAVRVDIVKPVFADLPRTTIAKHSGSLTVSHALTDSV